MAYTCTYLRTYYLIAQGGKPRDLYLAVNKRPTVCGAARLLPGSKTIVIAAGRRPCVEDGCMEALYPRSSLSSMLDVCG